MTYNWYARRVMTRVFTRTLLLRLGAAVALIYLVFIAAIWWAMRQPPETFGRVMSRMPGVAYLLLPFETMWTHARAGNLQIGNATPDFSLTKLDKSGTVQLSALTAKQPVVLVFGSYT
ncbi:MAG TPA: hypothetical protein VGV15_15970 [Terriglobales bacterium]|nr:hypothetical protein [Terriglobales bacterium]